MSFPLVANHTAHARSMAHRPSRIRPAAAAAATIAPQCPRHARRAGRARDDASRHGGHTAGIERTSAAARSRGGIRSIQQCTRARTTAGVRERRRRRVVVVDGLRLAGGPAIDAGLKGFFILRSNAAPPAYSICWDFCGGDETPRACIRWIYVTDRMATQLRS